jgi:hypothetical protein
MNMSDTRILLEEIAAIDNRELTPEVIATWNGILGSMQLDVARLAHKLARRDDRVRFLEPKHIVSWAREAAFKLDKEKPKQEEYVKPAPMPLCKSHGKKILLCDPCCHRLYKYSEVKGFDTLHDFATKEIYA